MLLTTVILTLALAADDPCALPTGPDARACSGRVGHCFDMDIDGQHVEPLRDAALRARLTEQVGSKAVCWTLPKPTAGSIDVVVLANEHTPDLGTLRKGFEVVVTGLEGQQVPTHKGIRSDPTVHIGGLPMQTAVDVIDAKNLPPGAYVVRVRVVGSQGYEDKSVYLHVERTADAKAHGRCMFEWCAMTRAVADNDVMRIHSACLEPRVAQHESNDAIVAGLAQLDC